MASGVTTSKVALTDSQITISGYNPKQEGAQTIDVTYKGQKEQFGVIVENNIQSIIMKTTPKTEYRYGEPLNIAGGTIETIRSNGAKVNTGIKSFVHGCPRVEILFLLKGNADYLKILDNMSCLRKLCGMNTTNGRVIRGEIIFNADVRSIWYSLSPKVWEGATTMESPVWTPTGSIFSMAQTMMQLSALSRMTSNSTSFQPAMLRSTRI